MNNHSQTAAETSMHVNTLKLLIERQEAKGLDGENRHAGYNFTVAIHVDHELIPTYATCLYSLTSSIYEQGEYFINTCSCGVASCIDIHDGVIVQHDGDLVLWYARPSFGYLGEDIEPVQYRIYRFDKNQYRNEIKSCLIQLVEMTGDSTDEDIFPVWGVDSSDLKEFLKLLANEPPASPPRKPAQERLWQSIEDTKKLDTLCALTDGADLLAKIDDWSPWDRAVGQYGRGNWSERNLLDLLVKYLPPIQPIMEEDAYLTNQQWALKHVIESAHAEILAQLIKPDGPVPLTEELLDFCKVTLTENSDSGDLGSK